MELTEESGVAIEKIMEAHHMCKEFCEIPCVCIVCGCLQYICLFKMGVVVHIYNPSTQEAEAGGLCYTM
jgi:hypothetical protein